MSSGRQQSRKQKQASRDPAKERLFRELAGRLEQAGITVRREELKRGHGFQVRSGTCRAVANKLLLIDRRLTQEEQLALVRDQLRQLGLGEAQGEATH